MHAHLAPNKHLPAYDGCALRPALLFEQHQHVGDQLPDASQVAAVVAHVHLQPGQARNMMQLLSTSLAHCVISMPQ
jgi:hypothetical protein